MNDQTTWEYATPEELVKAINDTEVHYRKLDMRWRAWFEEKNWIMDQLRGRWYMRRFIPESGYTETKVPGTNMTSVKRNGLENGIKLDNPFPPQGDLIVFLLIGDTRDYEAAEAAAKEIEEYFKANSDNYEPKLCIRSILFETASAYVAKLTKEKEACIAILGQPEVEESVLKDTVGDLQWCHEERLHVNHSVEKMSRTDQEMLDKLSLTESWRQLQKKVLADAADESKELEKYKAYLKKEEPVPTLTKTLGGLL